MKSCMIIWVLNQIVKKRPTRGLSANLKTKNSVFLIPVNSYIWWTEINNINTELLHTLEILTELVKMASGKIADTLKTK